jgi:hypothetical protein
MNAPAPTFAVPAQDGATLPTTHRAFADWYARHGAGRRFVLSATADGRCFLSVAPDCDDELLDAAKGLALLSS